MQNLISDWANVLMFFTVFIFGYIMTTNDMFTSAIDKHWKAALTVGFLVAILLSAGYTTQNQFGLSEASFYTIEMTS